jgi:uncharacterized protein YkwD
MLVVSTAPVRPSLPKPAQPRLLMAAWVEPPAGDTKAERELLDLANRARKQAGLTIFQVDEGLTNAARQHAMAMAERRQLSHQFPGEPELRTRLAANSSLYLVEAAENVAYAESADRAHDGLMHSVHHRENLLHPSYNVVGIGVVRRGGLLYVVQDFGNRGEKISTQESEAEIAEGVKRLRAEAKLPGLRHREVSAVHQEACAMATADSIQIERSSLFSDARRIVRYTTLEPGALPSSVARAVADRSLQAYTAGACFASSKSYPNGVYWVVLAFY